MIDKLKLWDLIFPEECVFCKEDGGWICRNCFAKLNLRAIQVCPVCKRKSPEGRPCLNCQVKTNLDKVLVATDYNDEKIKKLIKLLKYRFLKGLAPYLGDLITLFLSDLKEREASKIYLSSNTFLTPIPLHQKRYNWRGFNQAELISQRLAENLGIETKPCLERKKYHRPQTYFKRKERINNMKNTLSILDNNKVVNKKVILVDDVMTSGATLEESARVLKTAGARRVEALVVARE